MPAPQKRGGEWLGRLAASIVLDLVRTLLPAYLDPPLAPQADPPPVWEGTAVFGDKRGGL